MEIVEMVKRYLELRDHNGLQNSERECSCGLDDLMWCQAPDIKACTPAMRRITCMEGGHG